MKKLIHKLFWPIIRSYVKEHIVKIAVERVTTYEEMVLIKGKSGESITVTENRMKEDLIREIKDYHIEYSYRNTFDGDRVITCQLYLWRR